MFSLRKRHGVCSRKIEYNSNMLAKRLKENRVKRFFANLVRNPIKFFSPVAYVKLQYRYITHHKLNLRDPKRYTEKLQYLRLYVYPKSPLVVQAASHDGARVFVRSNGLEGILIKSYGVYSSFDEIPFDALPDSFVLKCTHASGFNEIVLDKKAWDRTQSRRRFAKWLKTDYGKKTVEPHYSRIKPRIIVEEYLGQGVTLPTEYKIHCFNGKAKNLYVVSGRGQDIRYDQFKIDWSPFPGAQFNGWEASDIPPKKPENFQKLVQIAERLASPFPFVRVDLYDIDNVIYFSELTFTPAKGTLIFDDDEADFEQGEWLDITQPINE